MGYTIFFFIIGLPVFIPMAFAFAKGGTISKVVTTFFAFPIIIMMVVGVIMQFVFG